MCGRFVQDPERSTLVKLLQLEQDGLPDLLARYNIAPTQDVATVVQPEPKGRRELRMLRWGLVPAWAADPKGGAKLINARSETAAEKPSFREAFAKRRCVIPANGFYEGKRAPSGKKQAFYIRRKDGQLLGMAGLWERWQGVPVQGEPVQTLETCTILTTAANALLATMHDRMPVILPESDFGAWLDPLQRDKQKLKELLRPAKEDLLEYYSVSPRVNMVGQDDANLIEPVPIEKPKDEPMLFDM